MILEDREGTSIKIKRAIIKLLSEVVGTNLWVRNSSSKFKFGRNEKEESPPTPNSHAILSSESLRKLPYYC